VDVISSACTKWIRTGYLDDSDTRKFVFLKLLFHVLNNAEFQKLVFSNEKEEVDLTGDDDENQMIDDVYGSQPRDADDGSQPGDADDGSQQEANDEDDNAGAEEKGKTAASKKKTGKNSIQSTQQSRLKQALKSIVPFGDFNFSGPAHNTRTGGQSIPVVIAPKEKKPPAPKKSKGKKAPVGSKVKTPALLPKGKPSSLEGTPTVVSTRRKRGSPVDTIESQTFVNDVALAAASEARKATDELKREQEKMRQLQAEMKRQHEALMKTQKNQSSNSIT
jgi:hypothetical protein